MVDMMDVELAVTNVAAWRYRYEPDLPWHVVGYENEIPSKGDRFPHLEVEPLYATTPAPAGEATIREPVAYAYYHDGQHDDVDHPVVSRIRNPTLQDEPWTEVALYPAPPAPAGEVERCGRNVMQKLTEAQRQTLRHLTIAGNSICQSVLTGSCWTRDGRFSIKVNTNTFYALALRGFIEKKRATVISSFYEITDAGRAALDQEAKRGNTDRE